MNSAPREEILFNAREICLAVVYYMSCSSLALVSNKVALHYVPMPGYLFCLQIAVTASFVYISKWSGLISVDHLRMDNVKVFVPYICAFVICLYSNGKALSLSNMETVIVFRACSPIFVSVLDFAFLGRELPSMRSFVALVGVVCGALGYVQTDSEFALNGWSAYTWVSINLAAIVFEMTYGKRLLGNVTFENPVWGSTLYTNVLALLPMFSIALSTGESSKFANVDVNVAGLFWVVVSCVTGVGISWSGWNCRNKVSATKYTLLGVVCKFISVLINVCIWNKHATPAGLLMLSVCLVFSSMYRQAPMRGAVQAFPMSAKDAPAKVQSSPVKPSLVGAGADTDKDASTTTFEDDPETREFVCLIPKDDPETCESIPVDARGSDEPSKGMELGNAADACPLSSVATCAEDGIMLL